MSDIMAETRAFIRSVLLDGSRVREPMTILDAQYNLDCWENDNVELPAGINAVILRYVWNEEVA